MTFIGHQETTSEVYSDINIKFNKPFWDQVTYHSIYKQIRTHERCFANSSPTIILVKLSKRFSDEVLDPTGQLSIQLHHVRQGTYFLRFLTLRKLLFP